MLSNDNLWLMPTLRYLGHNPSPTLQCKSLINNTVMKCRDWIRDSISPSSSCITTVSITLFEDRPPLPQAYPTYYLSPVDSLRCLRFQTYSTCPRGLWLQLKYTGLLLSFRVHLILPTILKCMTDTKHLITLLISERFLFLSITFRVQLPNYWKKKVYAIVKVNTGV